MAQKMTPNTNSPKEIIPISLLGGNMSLMSIPTNTSFYHFFLFFFFTVLNFSRVDLRTFRYHRCGMMLAAGYCQEVCLLFEQM